MIRYRSTGSKAVPNLPQATLDYLAHGAPEGQRNVALFAAACQFRDLGISPGETEGQLLSRAIRDGLTETEARNTIRSVFGKTPRGPASAGTAHGCSSFHSRPEPRKSAPKAKPPVPPVAPPLPLANGFVQLLDTCFRANEFVAIAPAKENEEGDIIPTRGVTLTCEEWKAKATAKGGIERCFSTPLGLFIRVNPMRRDGAKNEDVTAFRHVLVEFDRDEAGAPIPKEEQYAAILSSGFPVSVLIDSGNKSLHAWVRVDAPDAQEYKRRVDLIWEIFEGQALDKQNRNPSRLSRCPDGRRTVNNEVRVQKLLALNFGATSWDEWETARQLSELGEPISLSGLSAYDTTNDPNNVLGQRWLCRGSSLVLVGQSGILMQEGDKICIVRETGTDPVTSENTAMVAALVTLGVPFYETQPFLETREIVNGEEQRTVTWCLGTKTEDGRFKTRELIQWWRDEDWCRAKAGNPVALWKIPLEHRAHLWHYCVMAKTAILRARVDSEKKIAAEAVFAQLGISLSDAIALFLSQVGIQRAIPFPLTSQPRLDLSNAPIEKIERRYAKRIATPETQAALNEDTRKARRYKSSGQLLKALKA